jgi:hypothetical protein
LTTIEETGGTLSITSYNVERYDTDSAAWIEVVGDTSSYTSLSYTETGLDVGVDYEYRIRAKNIYGYGEHSSQVTVRTDDVPGKPDPMTTLTVGLNVYVQWSSPSLTNGSPITSYKVFLY